MAAPLEVLPRRRRTWPQRLLIAFNIFLIMCCLVAAGGLGYFYQRFGQLPRVALAKGILEPDPPPGDPQNYLLVGSDSRAFTEGDPTLAKEFGSTTSVTGQRSDTIILLRIDPKAKRALMLSLPRDLYIPISPTGRKDRINTAFDKGPQQLINTIKANFNIPINHYAEVNFIGFKKVVDAVGGVQLYLASPVRDRVSGLDIRQAGCIQLSGDQALAYVRSRHFEYQENGRWRTDPTGDFGRISRQQDFIRRVLKEAISKDLLNPAKLNRLVSAGIHTVTVDNTLDAQDILRLGKRFRSLSPDALEQLQLPVTPETVRGASVLFLDSAAAEPILARFRGDQTPQQVAATVPPSSVTVRVLNGSHRTGEAALASGALSRAGFAIGGTGTSPTTTSVTTIRYGTGQLAKAQTLQRYLVAGATLVEDTSQVGPDLVVVTGFDFAGVQLLPRAAGTAPATSSTVAGGPSTTTSTTAPLGKVPPPAPGC